MIREVDRLLRTGLRSTFGTERLRSICCARGDVMRRIIALVCLSLCLGGCYGWEQRHGISPVLDPAAVQISTSNQMLILQALAQDAGVPLGSPDSWYQVTQAGFNYVDDECRTYFNAIFFLNRDKDQIKTGLTAAGATTAAILGLTGASAKSIAIVAQAFGLSVVGTELVAGTYLYQMPPSVAQGFVKEMQLAYRDGAASRRLLINSPATAYHAIQDYLSLCLPPTIEAKIAENVATARAIPDPPTSSTNASFGITVTSPPAPARPSIIRNVNIPLQRFDPPRPPPSATRIGRFESGMSQKDMQRALSILGCSGADLGPAGSQQRMALAKFLADNGNPASQTITDDVFITLRELKSQGKQGTCGT